MQVIQKLTNNKLLNIPVQLGRMGVFPQRQYKNNSGGKVNEFVPCA